MAVVRSAALSASIGLALIAKDEAENLPHLLASITGAFDQVVLADTGSTDDTIEVFTRWAEREELPVGYVVEHFEWRDDFAAARNFADSLLVTDWESSADCDDAIVGAGILRHLAAQVPARLAGCVADWITPLDESGANRVCLPRLRLVRRGRARWVGRVHENLALAGTEAPAVIPRQVAHWVHRRPPADWRGEPERDRRILEAWLRDEPESLRVRQLMAGC